MMTGWMDRDEYTRLAARIGGWRLQEEINLRLDDAQEAVMDLLMDHFGPDMNMDPGSQHEILSVCYLAATALFRAHGYDLADHPKKSREALGCLAGLSWAAYEKMETD